ncbi:MAG: hypothetical protein R3A52_09270 [Polyangiales bacterium]
MKRWLSLFALALALGLGCAAEPHGAAPADDVTMAVLGTVRALHHEADVFEHAGDYARASQAVRRVLAIEYPRGMLEAPDLRADAWGRLAELALRAGNADDALSQANAGLEEARAENVFRARLMMVKGQSLGALADRARDVGDAAAERRHRDEALEALEASIAMNQRVLSRLADGGAR